MPDLFPRVGWELRWIRLAEVGGAADLPPSAVLGEEMLVEMDCAFDGEHPEGQVVGDVAPFGDPYEDLGGAHRVASGSVLALPHQAVHGADRRSVGLGDFVDGH